jgi:hypothetical protein
MFCRQKDLPNIFGFKLKFVSIFIFPKILAAVPSGLEEIRRRLPPALG